MSSPQTVAAGHADDVAMGMLLLSLGAAIGYEIYAWQLQLWPVLVMNGIFLVLVATEIVLKQVYDRRNRSQPQRAELGAPRVERRKLN